jgi:hypothetical protein
MMSMPQPEDYQLPATKGIDAKGQPVDAVSFYEKQ